VTQESGIRLQNWEGSVVSHPSIVTRPRNIDDIVTILIDKEKYPSPIRPTGSRHSTTYCTVADGGTVVDMTGFNQIKEIRPDTVTAEAGALYIDVSHELRRHGLQFYVNVEIGSLTIGSAACGGTKDASFPPNEFGQVSSYVCAMKIVTPSGELLEVTEDDPELLQALRSSYGLLGVIYEATFRVKSWEAMAVVHQSYSLTEFCAELPSLIGRQKSMMLYLFPFLNTITVEFREYRQDDRPSNRWVWGLRNWVWAKGAPAFAYYVEKLIPSRSIRYAIINVSNRLLKLVLTWVLKSRNTDPVDQTIRYPKQSGRSKYTFSIWAFPERDYPDVLRAYFAFCREYYKKEGYRCNLLNVGYRINEDDSALFSYSFKGTVVTVDPVSTGSPGWREFLRAYNDFCSERGGVPLFNQTWGIQPQQAKKAFGDRIKRFNDYRRQFDPTNRLFTPYFKQLLE
jgi:FAD/FMN-containing dehydrogenase